MRLSYLSLIAFLLSTRGVQSGAVDDGNVSFKTHDLEKRSCSCITSLFSSGGICQSCTLSGAGCNCEGLLADTCSNLIATCVVAGLSPNSINGCGASDGFTCTEAFSTVASSSVVGRTSSIPTPTASGQVSATTTVPSVRSSPSTEGIACVMGQGQFGSIGIAVAAVVMVW